MMRYVVIGTLVLCSSCSSTSPIGPSASRAGAPGDGLFEDVEFRGQLDTSYSSNPFRYSEADRDSIESLNGPGQKFDGLEQDWDVVTEVGLDASKSFRLGRRRDLEAKLGGEYNVFHYNDVASYAKYDAALDLSLGSPGSVELSFEYTPDRFRRNYRLPTGAYADGSYQQSVVALEYEKDITDAWSSGVGVEHADRDYGSQFPFRDRDTDGVSVFSRYDFDARTAVDARITVSDTDTGTENRGGVLRDRSFETLEFAPGLRTELGDWRLRLELEYRRREYTTNFAADDVRFGRVDDRYGVRVEALRRLGSSRARLRTYVEWLENKADVADPTATSDETQYEEIVVGASIRYSF